jgi:hypothetical protein
MLDLSMRRKCLPRPHALPKLSILTKANRQVLLIEPISNHKFVGSSESGAEIRRGVTKRERNSSAWDRWPENSMLYVNRYRSISGNPRWYLGYVLV